MSSSTASGPAVPWWKEPTKDQWLAWWAAWLGWTLDAFDFTIFLLLMLPISQTFNVPLVDVTFRETCRTLRLYSDFALVLRYTFGDILKR